MKSAYIESQHYGYWILSDGTLLPVSDYKGQIGALKHLGMSTNTEAFRANLVRLVTENQELWVQFEWVKPNSAQKNKLNEMARNWNFVKFIIESDYLPEDRYEFSNYLEFIRTINSIK
jgi:hypothetical protein